MRVGKVGRYALSNTLKVVALAEQAGEGGASWHARLGGGVGKGLGRGLRALGHAVAICCLWIRVDIRLGASLFADPCAIVAESIMHSIILWAPGHARSRQVIGVGAIGAGWHADAGRKVAEQVGRCWAGIHTQMSCIISPLRATLHWVLDALSSGFEAPRGIPADQHTNTGIVLCKVVGAANEGALRDTSSVPSLIPEGQGGAFGDAQVRGVSPEEPRQGGTDDDAKILASRAVSVVVGGAGGCDIGALGHTVSRGRVSPFAVGAEADATSRCVIPKSHCGTNWAVQRGHTCHVNVLRVGWSRSS